MGLTQWLKLYASNSGGGGSIPGQGTKIPHATQGRQKKLKNKNLDITTTSLFSVLLMFFCFFLKLWRTCEINPIKDIWPKKKKKENDYWDFPGGAVDKNPPASAGDMRSIPSPGRFNSAGEQLSVWATMTEAKL